MINTPTNTALYTLVKKASTHLGGGICAMKVNKILEQGNTLTDDQILRVIEGASFQGIYNIDINNPVFLVKREVLIDCIRDVDKEKFLSQVYAQGKSFLVLQQVFSILDQSNILSQNYPISINLHPIDFLDQNLTILFEEHFGTSSDCSHITLEILEHDIPDEKLAELLTSIQKIKGQYNFQVSYDDFDLSKLMWKRHQHLSGVVDEVKIDKSVLTGLTQARKNKLAYYVDMLLQQGKVIVVEGIETKIQYDLVKDLGIQRGQGWWFKNNKEKIKC